MTKLIHSLQHRFLTCSLSAIKIFQAPDNCSTISSYPENTRFEQGYSVSEAAASLGITTKLIYNWKAKLEEQQAGTSLSEGERAELKRLRRENKDLKMEKEILKKASAFFAREMK